MKYDLQKVTEFAERAKKLDSLDFKTLYFWLTEAYPRGWNMSGARLPRSLIVEYDQMGPWEKANSVDRLGLRLAELARDDFRRLSREARELDEGEQGMPRRFPE